MRIRSVRGNESGLTFRAAIGAGILTRGCHGEPAQVVRPTPVVARALCRVRKTAMGQAQQSAAVTLDQIDLDQARSRRHLSASFPASLPAETVGEAMDRHDLPERTARRVGAATDAFDR